ncbi:MAG TPA: ATP-grasp domain-containing protein [Pseudonocardiaceae bacterium]|nr:ATP-grasp domain-containing protein [Pseudonocardiaceae bacterium]
MTCSNPAGPAVIVDPYSSGVFYAPTFKEAGVPVVAVISRPEVPAVYRASYRPQDFPEVIPYDGELAPVVDRLRELAPRCVLPGTETGVELADRLAAAVVEDVANVPELIEARRHKGEMARAVAAAGLPVIRQICTADAGEVADWIEREGLADRDLVIKPPKSASTDGVTRVPGGRGWRSVFDAQLGHPNQWDVINETMLVQEYLTGTEYVVDTFSHAGVHTVTDVCEYRKIDNGPHMAVYDSMEWLRPDDPVVPDLVGYTGAVLDAVGMRYGATHVELMQTPDGPRLIELNARPHGGGQPMFCRVATGDSQVDRAVRFFARQGPIPVSYTLHQHLMVVFLIGRSAGTVRNAEVLDAVRELPSHNHSSIGVRNGSRIERTKDLLNTLALGFVVLAHPDRDQLMADYQRVRRIEAELVVTGDRAGVPA